MNRKTMRSGTGLLPDALILLTGLLWLVHFAARGALSALTAALILVSAVCCLALARAAGIRMFGPILSLGLVSTSIIAFLTWNTDGSLEQAIAVALSVIGVVVAMLGLYLVVRGGRMGGRQ